MQRTTACAAFFALAILASAVQLAHAGQIAANNMPLGYQHSGFHLGVGFSSPSINFINQACGQQFVSQISGPLDQITATVVSAPLTNVPPLIVEIHSANGLYPGELLGSINVPNALVSRGTLTTFDFSSESVQLQAGTSYIVVFKTEPPASQSLYLARLTASNWQSFGFHPLASRDFGATWIDPSTLQPPEIGLIITVPEPTTCFMGMVGGMVVALGRRKRA